MNTSFLYFIELNTQKSTQQATKNNMYQFYMRTKKLKKIKEKLATEIYIAKFVVVIIIVFTIR